MLYIYIGVIVISGNFRAGMDLIFNPFLDTVLPRFNSIKNVHRRLTQKSSHACLSVSRKVFSLFCAYTFNSNPLGLHVQFKSNPLV